MNQENAQSMVDRPADYADSIDAAAGALGVAKLFLKVVKGMGCPAFRAGRVYLSEVTAYVDANNLDALSRAIDEELGVDRDIKRERLVTMQHERQVREGRYLTREEHDDSMTRFNSEIRQALQEKLEDDGPDRLTMRTREEAQQVLRSIVDEICLKLSSR